MKKSNLFFAVAALSLGVAGLSGCFNRTEQQGAVSSSKTAKSLKHHSSSKKAAEESVRSSSSQSSSSSSSSISASSSSSSSSSAIVQTVAATQSGTNHIASANAYAYPASTVHVAMTGAKTSINHKVVFLTFDDGVNTSMSPRVLATLKQYGVHATFFIVGNTINSTTAPVLKQEYESGHGISIHSFTHPYNFNAPGNSGGAIREYHQTLSAMRNVLGPKFDSKVWRYPGGHMSWRGLAASDANLSAEGITWMDWNAAVGDALGASGPKTAAAMLQYHAKTLVSFPQSNVEVVLIHDSVGKELSLQILPQIIDYYKQHGYQFGILS